MNDGYEKWLAIAPEGKVPTRKGTADDAEKFVTAWQALPVGVDKKAPLGEVYDAAVARGGRRQPGELHPLGPARRARVSSPAPSAGQFVVPKALSGLINGGNGDAASAAKAADRAGRGRQGRRRPMTGARRTGADEATRRGGPTARTAGRCSSGTPAPACCS